LTTAPLFFRWAATFPWQPLQTIFSPSDVRQMNRILAVFKPKQRQHWNCDASGSLLLVKRSF
jgi:hypothetical protein